MTPAEFQETVLIHKNKLFRFAKRMLEDEEDARDVVQDTFLKLWAKRTELASVTNMEAFSMRTVKNLCIDRMRSLGYRNNLTSLEVAERSEKPGKTADALEMKDLRRLIQQIISQLPEQQKMVIQMRDIEGFEYSCIAETLEMEENAVRVALFRARKKVRELLEKIHNYEYTGN